MIYLFRHGQTDCDFCDLISNSYKSKNVLIVTHAANARVIDYYYTGKPADYDFSKTVIEKGEFITYDNSAVDCGIDYSMEYAILTLCEARISAYY